MNTRTWKLMGILLVLPAFGLAAEPPATHTSAPVSSADRSTVPSAIQPSFDLKEAAVQKVIRAAAASASDSQQAESLTASATRPALAEIPFRAPRRPHHMDCDSFNCVAYTADDEALYTVPRDQYFGVNSNDPQEAWLSCQSGNDLLTTFERYDKCRGVSIGLPLQGHDLIVDLPKLTL